MSTQSRLWIASPARDADADQGLLERLAGRPLGLVAHAPGARLAALASGLGARTGASVRVLNALGRPDDSVLECLGELAAEFADRELAVITAPEVLRLAAAATLGLKDPAPAGLDLRPGALGAFNWPADRLPGQRPELLGLDLDWLPPVQLGQPRSRFPGGPGVAGTSR